MQATGKIYNNARVLVSTATCFEPLLASSGMYDISGFVQQTRVALDAETRDNTTMGMSFRSQKTALRSATMEVRLLQEFDVSMEPVPVNATSSGSRSIHGLLYDLYRSDNKFIVSLRPENAIRSACNPEMWMPASLQTHTPLDGSVADLLVTNVRFNSQGDFANTVSSSA